MRSLFTWNLAVWLVVFVGVPTASYLLFLYFARWKRSAFPACGRCRYAVERLPTKICPECGADLTIVGTIVHDPRPWWALAGRLVSLAIVLFFCVQLIAPLATAQFPVWVQTQCMIGLAPTDPNAKFVLNVYSNARHWQSRTPPYFEAAPPATHVQILLSQQRATFVPSVEIDRTHDTYTIVTNAGMQTCVGPFGHPQLASWLQSVTVSPNAAHASASADIIMRIMDDSVDAYDVVRELEDQWNQEIASGTVRMPLRVNGDFRNSNPLSDHYAIYALFGIAALLWLWVAWRTLRGPKRTPLALPPSSDPIQ